ncbi:MAG: N-6 DNA methylase, partial [Myxococcota bacterium]
TSQNVAAVIVEQGKVLDFIDGATQRRETPEEYVRQEIAKSLVREYGYNKADIEVEFTLHMGTRKPRADLAIFPPGEPHKQENVRVLVECKAPRMRGADRREGTAQLESYLHACPNAVYGMWTNGTGGERLCFKRMTSDGKVRVEQAADIPQAGRDDVTADRPAFDQLKPATSDALLFAFRRCHNYIAGNQGLQKPQAFWELLKLIFCKIHDEHHNNTVEFFAGPSELHGVNGPNKVVRRIEALFDAVKANYPAIFRESDTIELNPDVLAYLVAQLQLYSLLQSEIDVKGRAYEEVVGANLRGDRGEFFTPRNVCRMAVAMLDPREDQLILDPACGTGGFLITAMNHVIEQIQRAEEEKWGRSSRRFGRLDRARVSRFADKCIVGIDFNPELVKAAKMNMVMNNDGAGGLFAANSLKPPMTWSDELRERDLLGRVDLLFTNPPFGSKIPVTDPSTLEQYDLAHAWKYDKASDTWNKTGNLRRAQTPEILFVERCVRFLKQGTGRAAMVVPDGVLGSPGSGYVREWILRNTRILASIDLHEDTFQPFVGVHTSLLVVQRKSADLIAVESASGKLSDYPVFMAMANHVGHDRRGNVTYVRDREGNEVFQDVTESVEDQQDGIPVRRTQTVRRKVVDDNTLQIAEAFRKWLSDNP